MTYFAPDKVPYDEWFDPDYKYEPHPYDNWPMATDKTPVERLHDDMRKAVSYTHLTLPTICSV